MVTRVGKLLQKSSLDEFPQIWNILKGEMSLIGPRNDTAGLGERLAVEIPYYKIRYFVKPGVTGWAQTNQRYLSGSIQPQSLEESRIRFSYDLYYVKNRSFWLDLAIALRTTVAKGSGTFVQSGSAERCLSKISLGEAPRNGGIPVIISYSTAPSA